MTSVNTVATRVLHDRRTAAPGPAAENRSRGSAGTVEVVPLWAAPCAPVLPVGHGR
ncbi:hypothetical protein ACFCX4_32870 [Kitasatospora sp. NPDC056327]|uniref:hypothetical protein n=1 Tax=Kitasatospora sp. NPDC056327 TaxID=3345785 RepID=UPI0035E289DA